MAELMERKRLIEYLPRFMQDFSELKELLNITNGETDAINTQVGRILDEAFIDDCTEYGIKKYESICGILPADTDTLEERKARVKIKWNDSIPYTFIALIRKLNVYCGGADFYDIDANMEDYEISIFTHLSLSTTVQEVEKMIDRIMPANMHYESFNNIEHTLNAILYSVGATIQAIHTTIQTETNKSELLETQNHSVGAIMTHKLVEISSETEQVHNLATTTFQSGIVVTHKTISIN